jgi:hypothetical protein
MASINSNFDTIAAYRYITERYNPHYGLVSENEHINQYWLWSDNILAAQVLRSHDHNLYTNITNTIKGYIQSYNISLQSAYTVLIDQVFTTHQTSSFNALTNRNLLDNIWYSDYNGDEGLQCAEYADIAFLKSIYFYKTNKTSDSKTCYEQAMNMFDGIGFKDKSFVPDGSKYSTYKVALWKIASSITKLGKSNGAMNIISKMQDSNTGGVYTFYSKDFVPGGQTNVETTSLSILANTMNG